MDNLRTNFIVSGTFRSRLMGQHLSEGQRDFATLTFDLGGHGCLRAQYVYGGAENAGPK